MTIDEFARREMWLVLTLCKAFGFSPTEARDFIRMFGHEAAKERVTECEAKAA